MADARPRARPEKARPVQPAESAAVETASAQPPSTAQSRVGAQDARAQWGAAIRKKVERRKAYPKAARGASGEVVVKMTVSRTGALEAVAIARSSGNAALDQAALTAVRRTGGFPAAPDQVTGDRQVFSLPMQFAP
ncbi:MAG: energy transducer TonB [Exiguobacterium profundum]|nr:MAG: energy transducer TonB [Exiguobacterium profundum]